MSCMEQGARSIPCLTDHTHQHCSCPCTIFRSNAQNPLGKKKQTNVCTHLWHCVWRPYWQPPNVQRGYRLGGGEEEEERDPQGSPQSSCSRVNDRDNNSDRAELNCATTRTTASYHHTPRAGVNRAVTWPWGRVLGEWLQRPNVRSKCWKPLPACQLCGAIAWNRSLRLRRIE